MDSLSILRAIAVVLTVSSAAMVAANWTPRTTFLGFGVGVFASIAWMADGWMENKVSLLVQNFVFLIINIVGVVRWLPKVDEDQLSKSSV